MPSPLRILIVEDRAADAELMVAELRRAGFEPGWQRVETEADYAAQLEPDLDVILCDYRLPSFDAARALELLAEHRLGVPFIVISGDLDEEAGVELMKQGAADYLLKDRLERLGQAVVQALERKRAEEALRESEELHRGIVETSSEGIVTVDADGRITFANARMAEMLGYRPDELVGRSAFDLVDPGGVEAAAQRLELRRRGEGERYDVLLRRRDGGPLWVHVSSSALTDARGNPAGSLSMVADITERKQAEQRLAEAERRYRTLVEQGPAIVYVSAWDEFSTNLYISPQVEEVLGYPAERWLDTRGFWAEILHPDDRERVLELAARCHAEQTEFRCEYRMVAQDGRTVWLREEDAIVRDEEGAPQYTQGVMYDITEQRLARERLVEAEERHRTLVEQIPAITYTAAVTGTSTTSYVSPQVEAVLGYAPHEFDSEPELWARIAHPQDRAAAVAAWREPGEGRAVSEYRLMARDGREVWFHDESVVVRDAAGRPSFRQGVIFDITARRHAEQQLGTHARQQAAVVDLGQRALAGGDLETLMEDAVGLVATTLEVECCEVLELLPAGDELLLRAGVGWEDGLVGSATVEAGRDSQAGYTLDFDDPVIVEDLHSETRFSAPPLLTGHGVVSGMSAIIQTGDRPFGVLGAHTTARRSFTQDDVHFLQAIANVLANAIHRKQVEDEIRVSRDRLQGLLDNTSAIVYVKDRQHRYTLVNKTFERLYNLPSDELIGRTAADMLPPEVASKIRLANRRVLEQGEVVEYEEEIPRDGEALTYLTVEFPLRDPAGAVYALCGIASDITERERLKERLGQSQRLESVGQLAGGIAHDFNNLLAVILNYTGFVGEELEQGSPARDDLEQIRRAAERASALTHQLLLFSRQEAAKPDVVDLNALVAGTEKLLRRTIGEQVELVSKPAPDLGPVLADPGQLEQALVNLVVNARNAMPDGGTLSIETAGVELDADHARQYADVAPGRYVRLTVSDTGHGMTPEVRARAVEPFFTTKPHGKGTGLGLATVFGIVSQAGGHLDIYSQPDRGTTVKVYLPVTSEQPSGSGKPADTTSPRGAGETILVVEDEEAVRKLTSRILREHCYEVLEAGTPAEALEALEQHEPSLDLLLTDVVMPGMSGAEMANRMGRLRGSLRVLYMSGYTDDVIVRHGVLEEPGALIEKPFSQAVLLQKVRDTLAAPPNGGKRQGDGRKRQGGAKRRLAGKKRT